MSNPSPSKYPGLNVLIFGESGTGKTYSIKTLVDAGLDVFALFLEPGLETLIGAYSDHDKPIPKNLHWHYLQPRTQGFAQLQSSADAIGKFDLSGLAKMKDMKRGQNNPIIDLYGLLNDFQDQHTGEKFGPVDSWGNDRVLVIDSLSALSRMLFEMVIGTKPVKDMADWGIVQQALMSLLHKLTSGCVCHFVLIAHVEREQDLISGGTKLMLSAPGKAITAQIPQPFSDVILSARENATFYWDTANSQASVKTRNLPIASKNPADFAPIVAKWQKRRALAEG
jgi:hypothetical protein